VIILAGAWAAVLIFYRMLDQSSLTSGKNGILTTGIQWGIFLALFAAIWLGYTGVAMRRTHRREPALADDPTVHLANLRHGVRAAEQPRPAAARNAPASEAAREHRGVTREDAEQLSFELPHDHGD